MELQKPKGNEPHEDPRMKTLETTASAPIKPSPLASRLQSPPPPTSPSLPQQPASEENVEELRKEGDEGGEQKATKPPSTEIAEAEGPVTDLQKKLRRAERFGVTVQLSEHEKRSSRAERFGTGSTLPGTIAGSAEEQKRKARAERFGLVGHSTDDEAKKKARVEKFAENSKPNTAEEEKRKARAIRFSQTSNASSESNGKTNSEMMTATVAKATGGA